MSRTYAPRTGAEAGERRAAEAGAGCAVDHDCRLLSGRMLPHDNRAGARPGRRPRRRPQLQLQSLGLTVGRAAAAHLSVPCMFVGVFMTRYKVYFCFPPGNLVIRQDPSGLYEPGASPLSHLS